MAAATNGSALGAIDLTAESFGDGRDAAEAGLGVTGPRPVSTVSLVIPARNEARNLGWVLEQVPSCVSEVILVDGCSTDASCEMARYYWPGVRIVSDRAQGKGSALRAGFEASTGDAIVMLDADGSMSATEIPRFLHFLDHGYDFVKGSRFVAGGGSFDLTRLRRAGNRGLMALVNVLYDTTLTDLCYGFVAFRRRYLPYLQLRSVGFEIETEMVLHALRAGLRIAEVPSVELPRRSGQSRLRTFHDGARVLRTVMQERFGPVEAPDAAETEVHAVG
jgi:glycosyltransferase involved in cell wall biosynthesis